MSIERAAMARQFFLRHNVLSLPTLTPLRFSEDLKKMPFFSVLMPTRNRACLLRSSLRTAVEQKFPDYEIIVSDNNSTDDTKAVIEDFMKSSNKIRYVN